MEAAVASSLPTRPDSLQEMLWWADWKRMGREYGDFTFHMIQILTGYGCFGTYLCEINRTGFRDHRFMPIVGRWWTGEAHSPVLSHLDGRTGRGGVLFRKLELDMDLERIWRNIWRSLWALSPKIDGRNVLRDRHDEEKRGRTSASKWGSKMGPACSGSLI